MRQLAFGIVIALAMLGPVQAAVPAVGSQAPAFTLPDQHGKPRHLTEWRGRWVVLYFYPKDDTPGCTTEACNFRDDISLITQLGAQVVGVSIDDTASHKAFAEKYRLPFPLLADTGASVARQYGALSDWVVVRMARRYSFIIDPAGRIARVYLEVDPARHVQEIVADLKRLSK